MNKWILQNRKSDISLISEELKISRLMCKIMANRGITNVEAANEYLNGEVKNLENPYNMKDMKTGVEIIKKAKSENKRIRIVGDYDQDGISATVILNKGFKRIGLEVDYDIPERMKDGYGINKRIIDKAVEDGIDMIITCDNGIAAIEEIAYAKEKELVVIVTDHHEIIDGRLPNADAIINPKREECKYSFKEICGAAVAFKLIEALYNEFEIDKNELEVFYEFVAMATVCDIMDLLGENRILVKKGLENLSNTNNLGLHSLKKALNLEKTEITAYHLGYRIGPCINAAGRLETASMAVELFLTEDKNKAEEISKILYDLNEERKSMTNESVDRLIELARNSEYLEDKILVLHDENIHESIAGIVAGRIKDQFKKPTLVITSSVEENIKKGSGRSIEAYDMFLELSKNERLFKRFGGHTMAAGFSLEESNISELRKNLNENHKLTDNDLVKDMLIDASLGVKNIDLKIAKELEKLEPFGKGNRKPLFGDKNLNIVSIRELGSGYKILKINFKTDKGIIKEAIYFGSIDDFKEYIYNKFDKREYEKAILSKKNNIVLDILFNIGINEYNNKINAQIVIKDYRKSS